MPRRTVALDVFQKCEYIAPGQMGVVRKPMLTMETLQRPALGIPMTRGRPKQPKGFIYGMKYPFDPQALAKCLNWPITDKSTENPENFPRDFLKTNIESAKAGIHPVPSWEQFANSKNYRLDPTKQALGRNKKPHFPNNILFGRPPRPQTPINCILAHQYKTEFDDAAIARNKSELMSLAISENKIPQPCDTTKSAVEMVPLVLPSVNTKPWQLHRFQLQKPRVTSHWTREDEARIMTKIFEKPMCDATTKK